MRELITCAMLPVINEKGISSERLNYLIYLRDFIDRISSKKYLTDEELHGIRSRYGVLPDVISWGDFFQAELATSLQNADDDAFYCAFETVKFDMISSYLIFSGKGPEFFEWVDNSFSSITLKGQSTSTEDEKEIMHLKALMDYYLELSINGNFTEAELTWHSSFKQAHAV